MLCSSFQTEREYQESRSVNVVKSKVLEHVKNYGFFSFSVTAQQLCLRAYCWWHSNTS